jgi:hypothetical protein
MQAGNVSVLEAARIMGVSQQFVRVGLQQGILPFGCAIQITKKKYTYFISRAKLAEYVGIDEDTRIEA